MDATCTASAVFFETWYVSSVYRGGLDWCCCVVSTGFRGPDGMSIIRVAHTPKGFCPDLRASRNVIPSMHAQKKEKEKMMTSLRVLLEATTHSEMAKSTIWILRNRRRLGVEPRICLKTPARQLVASRLGSSSISTALPDLQGGCRRKMMRVLGFRGMEMSALTKSVESVTCV